jgi:lantibiotic modifying enzyme
VKISDAEFTAIVKAAADWHDYFPGQPFPVERIPHSINSGHPLPNLSSLPEWAAELRTMFDAISNLELSTRRTSPIFRLCEIGSRYGMQRLEAEVAPEFWVQLTPRAKMQLKRQLERTLARTARPCLALELDAFRFAYEGIYSQQKALSPDVINRRLVGDKPIDRLFLMFKKFPVLARLWSQLISQWCDQTAEALLRFDADKRALSHVVFRGQRISKIIDLRASLSDPHNHGRAVMLLRFEAGSIIYKPRPGNGEQEWFTFLHWMNARSFRPKLGPAKVLLRNGYCWMEHVESAPCKDRAAARRYYQRLGGMIAAAYLLRAVDCHRDNIIASGEYPVLVDAEALSHARETKTESPLEILFRTGFVPNAKSLSSLQFRSSVLGKTTAGQHSPRIGAKALNAAQYEREIIEGFSRAWRCIIGTKGRRAAFARRLRRLRAFKHRWIYRSTERYNAIRRASITPAAMRSGFERNSLIARLCSRSGVPSEVILAEIRALKHLDIPYFSRKVKKPPLCDKRSVPTQMIEALRRTLSSCV